jgi:hypothetical protein
MFLFPYREDLIRSEAEERLRRERRDLLLRELRGATPPFDGGLSRRLVAALSETAAGGATDRRRRSSQPHPEVKEVMSS